MIFRTASAVSLACALAAPVLAADSNAAEEQDGGTIIVTGTRDSYLVEETSTATRTPTKLIDVPQSLSIVTEAQIDDQSLRSIADVLRTVPGATFGQGEGHRDQITLRGNNSTADFFVDGLRGRSSRRLCSGPDLVRPQLRSGCRLALRPLRS